MFAADIPGSTHAHAVEYPITSTFTAWNQSSSPCASQQPMKTTPIVYLVVQRVRPAFAEVTAEDHPDKVRESEQESPSLVHRLVSALHSIFIIIPPLKLEKKTITRPIRLHKLSKLLIAGPIHNSVTIELSKLKQ